MINSKLIWLSIINFLSTLVLIFSIISVMNINNVHEAEMSSGLFALFITLMVLQIVIIKPVMKFKRKNTPIWLLIFFSILPNTIALIPIAFTIRHEKLMEQLIYKKAKKENAIIFEEGTND